jgi:hypothetical protein
MLTLSYGNSSLLLRKFTSAPETILHFLKKQQQPEHVVNLPRSINTVQAECDPALAALCNAVSPFFFKNGKKRKKTR